MKPVQTYFGHVTSDLTEAKVHLVDGELIAFTPKRWDVMDEVEVPVLATGQIAKIKRYRVTEWDARKLNV